MADFYTPSTPEYDRTFDPSKRGPSLLPNQERNPCREMPLAPAQPNARAAIGPTNKSNPIPLGEYAKGA